MDIGQSTEKLLESKKYKVNKNTMKFASEYVQLCVSVSSTYACKNYFSKYS